MNILPQSLLKEVFDLLCDHQTARAVLIVRQELSVGLKDAVAMINEVRSDCFRRVESSGMSISIVGVGRLQEPVADHLDYDRSLYDGVSPGTPVCVNPFELCAAPVEVVRRYCLALGVTDVTDFNRHPLDSAIDFNQLAPKRSDDADLCWAPGRLLLVQSRRKGHLRPQFCRS